VFVQSVKIDAEKKRGMLRQARFSAGSAKVFARLFGVIVPLWEG
jgi:hypothetical protein